MTTLVHPSYVLSDENKLKVCLIADINKLSKLIDGKILTAEDFDELYDCDEDQLHMLISAGTIIVQQREAMRKLAQAVFRIQDRANQHRKNNEEGD